MAISWYHVTIFNARKENIRVKTVHCCHIRRILWHHTLYREIATGFALAMTVVVVPLAYRSLQCRVRNLIGGRQPAPYAEISHHCAKKDTPVGCPSHYASPSGAGDSAGGSAGGWVGASVGASVGVSTGGSAGGSVGTSAGGCVASPPASSVGSSVGSWMSE